MDWESCVYMFMSMHTYACWCIYTYFYVIRKGGHGFKRKWGTS